MSAEAPVGGALIVIDDDGPDIHGGVGGVSDERY